MVAPDMGQDVDPPCREEGADEVPCSEGQHGQACRRCPTKDADEHGLGAIVGVMTGGDDGTPLGPGGVAQGLVPCGSGPGLEVGRAGGPRQGDAGSAEGNAELPRQRCCQRELVGRVGPQAVVDAVGHHRKAVARGQRGEDVEERLRVGTSADRH